MRTSPFLRQQWSDRRGTAAVEFAILAPVFLLIMLGMIAYGIYFGASHSLEQIAADAARTAVAGASDAERQALVAQFIAKSAGGYPLIQPKSLTVEVRDSKADSTQFVVTIRYDAGGLPIWSLFENLPLPGKIITRSSTIRAGGA